MNEHLLPRLRDNLFSIETIYILFLFAGLYKESEIFSWVPINITVLFGFLTISSVAIYLITNNLYLTRKRITILGLFFVLVFYAAISGIWSPSVNYFQIKFLRLLVINGLSLLVPILIISTSETRMRRLGFLAIGIGLFISVLSIINYLLGLPWGVAPLNASYLVTGRALGLTALILIYIMVIYNSLLNRIQLLSIAGSIAISLIALTIVGARGPLVSAILSVIFLFGIVLIHEPKHVLKIGFKQGILVFVFSILAIPIIGDQLRGIQRLLILLDGPGSSLGTRLQFYSWTLQNLRFPSILYGEGFASWPVYHSGMDVVLYPHNVFLEIIFELGIIGFIILISLIVFSFRGIISDSQDHLSKPGILLTILAVFMIININITGHLGTNRYFYAVIGLLCYHHTNRIPNKQAGKSIDTLVNRH